MDCSSKNLLYVIKCEGCEENYIGQTGNDLRKRMTVHRQQIKDPSTRKIPLSAHLSECAGNKDNYFTLFPFYKFPINGERERLTLTLKPQKVTTDQSQFSDCISHIIFML